MTLAALGVFILWMGWFGFNPGSTLSGMAVGSISHIFMTTNIAAAAGGLVALIITWQRYGKPDISMTLNGILAGLVAITAGCDIVSVNGAICIGIIAAFVVTFGIELVDKVLKVDDPVGAVGVHAFCGSVGTLLVGFFANGGGNLGLFYGGGLHFLGVQALGVVSVFGWAVLTSWAMFKLIDKTIGLRVSKDEEKRGLDFEEHGLQSCYADFQNIQING
jgi:Amt family ammonium transporter